MKKYLLSFNLIFIGLLLMHSNCSKNLFSSVNQQKSDTFFFQEAQKASNTQNFDLAISILETNISFENQYNSEYYNLLADSYAGKCGLNFLDFTDKLNANIPSFFKLLSNSFTGKNVLPDYCLQALRTLDKLGTVENRSSELNSKSAIISLALIGATLKKYTDIEPIQSFGDGENEVSVCTITEIEPMNYFALGLTYLYENVNYLPNSIANQTKESIEFISTNCKQMINTECLIKDESKYTDLIRTFFKSFLNTQQYGVGSFTMFNEYKKSEDIQCLSCSCQQDPQRAYACKRSGCIK